MWVRVSEELCRRLLLCEKNLVGMDTARGSLALFEIFLVFSVGQFNEKEKQIETELSIKVGGGTKNANFSR